MPLIEEAVLHGIAGAQALYCRVKSMAMAAGSPERLFIFCESRIFLSIQAEAVCVPMQHVCTNYAQQEARA